MVEMPLQELCPDVGLNVLVVEQVDLCNEPVERH
jgi:hypothetical protein